MINPEFHRILTSLRKERKLSQKAVAEDLGLSQALLSHYEKGTREPGLGFVCMICDYYGVSADYVLARSLSKDGAMIPAEEVYDSTGERGTELRGNVLSALEKKMLMNSAAILFDLLGKLENREAILAAADCLGTEIYDLYRSLYRAAGEDEDCFSLADEEFNIGSIDMMKQRAKIDFKQALRAMVREDVEFPLMDSDEITKNYPGLCQSLMQILHNVEVKTEKVLENKG